MHALEVVVQIVAIGWITADFRRLRRALAISARYYPSYSLWTEADLLNDRPGFEITGGWRPRGLERGHQGRRNGH